MNPAMMHTISTQRGREVREQAAAWRRVREARSGTAAGRGAWARFVPIGRNGRVLAGREQLPGQAAA